MCAYIHICDIFLGVATTNNKVTQKRIAEERTIPTLVNLLNDPLNDPTGEVQVEVAMSLGCIVLSNPNNHEALRDIKEFSFDVLLDLLKYQDQVHLFLCAIFQNQNFYFQANKH